MTPFVSHNGQLVNDTSSALSLFDRGFLLGDGLFETLRVSAGTPWYLDRHLDRLHRAADRLGLTIPDVLRGWVHALLDHTIQQGHTADLALRITITRGGTAPSPLSGMTTPPATPLESTVVLSATEPPKVPQALYEKGVTAHIATGVRNERGLVAGLKTTSYIESIVALRDAHAAGFDDAIFLDTHGFVSEATASNVFVVIDGALVTPAVTHGILPGITRAVLLELAHQHDIPIAERELGYQELLNAREAFLTSSLRGIMPLVRVDDATIGRGVPDVVTHRLTTLYAAHTPRV